MRVRFAMGEQRRVELRQQPHRRRRLRGRARRAGQVEERRGRAAAGTLQTHHLAVGLESGELRSERAEPGGCLRILHRGRTEGAEVLADEGAAPVALARQRPDEILGETEARVRRPAERIVRRHHQERQRHAHRVAHRALVDLGVRAHQLRAQRGERAGSLAQHRARRVDHCADVEGRSVLQDRGEPLAQHRLQRGSLRPVALRAHQVERPAVERSPHDRRGLGRCRRADVCRREAGEPRGQPEVRRLGPLRLQPADPSHRLGDGHVGALEEQLPREQRAVQPEQIDPSHAPDVSRSRHAARSDRRWSRTRARSARNSSSIRCRASSSAARSSADGC